MSGAFCSLIQNRRGSAIISRSIIDGDQFKRNGLLLKAFDKILIKFFELLKTQIIENTFHRLASSHGPLSVRPYPGSRFDMPCAMLQAHEAKPT